MTDPDLQIRERPSHPDPEIVGEPGLKNFFRPFRPQFGLKIRGRGGPPGPSPGSTTEKWSRLLTRGGLLRELSIVRLSLKDFSILDWWSLMACGRYREVVMHMEFPL